MVDLRALKRPSSNSRNAVLLQAIVGSENEAGDDTMATKKSPAPRGAFYFVQTGYRESSDSPRLKAFCRVAPSERFKVRAMIAARVFLRAIVFNVRTSDDVHERRFDFLGI